MKTCRNDTLFAVPFETTEVKVKVNSGFATISQKQELTPLRVLIGTNDISSGSVVWVNADSCKLPWASRIYKINDLEGIFVPIQSVLVVDTITQYESGCGGLKNTNAT